MIDSILESRYQRAIETLNQENIDAWIITGRETNILGEPALLFLMPIQVGSRTTLIITKEGDRIMIAPPLEMEEMEDSGLFTECINLKSILELENTIVKVLKNLESPNKIALNFSKGDPSSDGLSYTDYKMLERCFNEIGFKGEIVSSVEIMKNIRGRKSDEEVEKIANAVSKAMEIFEIARSKIKVGMSGFDVQQLFKNIIAEKGYGYSWYEPGNPYVSVGTRSSYLCKRPPKNVYIEEGDLVNVDLGIRVDGYASDNQRSFYALREGETKPPEEIIKAFNALSEMNREVCKGMKAGFNSDDLTGIGNKVMLAHGYEDGWTRGYGHEIGLFAHSGGISSGLDPVRKDLDKTLLHNMTFTIEPAIITSHGRLCQEEVVVVKENSGEFLSTPQEEIWIINK